MLLLTASSTTQEEFHKVHSTQQGCGRAEEEYDHAFLRKNSSLKRFSNIERGCPGILVEPLYLEAFKDMDLVSETRLSGGVDSCGLNVGLNDL